MTVVCFVSFCYDCKRRTHPINALLGLLTSSPNLAFRSSFSAPKLLLRVLDAVSLPLPLTLVPFGRLCTDLSRVVSDLRLGRVRPAALGVASVSTGLRRLFEPLSPSEDAVVDKGNEDEADRRRLSS